MEDEDRPLIRTQMAEATLQRVAVRDRPARVADGRRIVEVVDELLGDRVRLANMSRVMRGLARPDAAARIVDRVLELARA